MKIHVSELEGWALDYAVAVASGGSLAKMGEGFKPHISMPGVDYVLLDDYSPSTDWGQCGPLLERFSFQICGSSESGYFVYAIARDGHKENKRAATGFHLRQTICRAIVAAKLGEEVEIPDELVK